MKGLGLREVDMTESRKVHLLLTRFIFLHTPPRAEAMVTIDDR